MKNQDFINSCSAEVKQSYGVGHSSANLKGFILATLTAFFFATNTSLGKIAMFTVSPLTFCLGIYFFSSIYYLYLLFFTTRVSELVTVIKTLFTYQSSGTWLFIYAITAMGGTIFFWLSVSMIDPTVALFVYRTEAVLVIILSVIFLNERFSFTEILGLLIVFSGVFLIRYTDETLISNGVLLMLLSAISFSVSLVCAKKLVRIIPPSYLGGLRTCLVLPMLAVTWILFDNPQCPESLQTWFLFAVGGFLGPFAGRLTFLMALKYIPLSRAAIFQQSQPVLGFFVSYVLLSLIPTPLQWLGGLLIILGIILVQIKHRIYSNNYESGSHLE